MAVVIHGRTPNPKTEVTTLASSLFPRAFRSTNHNRYFRYSLVKCHTQAYSPDLLPAATKLGQGNVFTGRPVHGGGWSVPGGSPNFRGSIFLGGLQMFRGGLQIFGGSPNFRHPPIRLMSGPYASYWNAFLFS